MSFDWNMAKSTDYVKWDTKGMTVSGLIEDIDTNTFEARDDQPAKTFPRLHLDTAERGRCKVTCSNADLLEQVATLKPQIGDRIKITYLRDVPTSFGGQKKLFSVETKSGAVASKKQDDQEVAPF